jgi:hypothetical protein
MADIPGRLFKMEGRKPENSQALAGLPQRWDMTAKNKFPIPHLPKRARLAAGSFVAEDTLGVGFPLSALIRVDLR